MYLDEMKKLLFIPLLVLIGSASWAQSVQTNYRDQHQHGDGLGFLALGVFLTTAPVAVEPYIATPTLTLFSIGCASLITGIVLHGVENRNYRRLQLTPGAISYKF